MPAANRSPSNFECARLRGSEFSTRLLKDGTILLRVHVADARDDVGWEEAVAELRRFMKWVKKEDACYALHVSLASDTGLGLSNIIDVCELVRKRREVLLHHLRGTIVEVLNPTVRALIATALGLFPAVRPFEVRCPSVCEDVVASHFMSLSWPDGT